MENKIKQKNINFKNFLTGMKKIFTSSLIIIASLLVANQVAFADSSVLFPSPASGTSTISKSFDISVQINPQSNNVCVVKGTINLNKLTCQSITLASGIIGQTVPTCTVPNFTLGIPKCTTSTKNLFSVKVLGSEISQGSLSLGDVKVIGAGVDVAYNLQGGIYNIVVSDEKKTSTTTASTSTPPTIIPKVINPKENTEVTTDTGIEIPKGVGQSNSAKDNGENISTTTSSSSQLNPKVAVKENNGLVATVFESLSNIPNNPLIALVLIAIVVMSGFILYNRRKN